MNILGATPALSAPDPKMASEMIALLMKYGGEEISIQTRDFKLTYVGAKSAEGLEKAPRVQVAKSELGFDVLLFDGSWSLQHAIAFVFGVAFIITLIVLAIAFPSPTPFQYNVFRIVLSLAAAGLAAMIPGFIDLQVSSNVVLLIRAGGALAVFLVVFFFNPARLVGNDGS